jgi:tetratricopeptide (TPR) repeat protein
MFKNPENSTRSTLEVLADEGYWPAVAARYLASGKYSKVVAMCREHLADEPMQLSGRLVYARALAQAGQTEAAVEQFYQVLSHDPDNVVALKYLGDAKFKQGDEVGALAHYHRVLELDPGCAELKMAVRVPQPMATRTVTISRGSEPKAKRKDGPAVYFYTETLGDIYLKQGHPRMAREVFAKLQAESETPQLAEKLAKTEEKIREKERKNVS